MKNYLLEIACFNRASAERALQSSADRIELCADGYLGGTTPSLEDFVYLKNNYTKPIFVMIRPRGGDFNYSNEEFEKMKTDILRFKEAGADGLVFGILTAENAIDTERNLILKNLAGDTRCTFHRAFDDAPDVKEAIEILISTGFSTVLTSGCPGSAPEGTENLKFLEKNYGDKIEILVGGGVRAHNISELRDATQATSFHSSALVNGSEVAVSEEIELLKKNLITNH